MKLLLLCIEIPLQLLNVSVHSEVQSNNDYPMLMHVKRDYLQIQKLKVE